MVELKEGGALVGEIPTKYNPNDPIPLFIIQVVLIIVFTRLLNVALSPLKQPRVISEIIGGIILGPSVLGKIPGYMENIFPDESRAHLNLAANLGLVFFLFLVGVEMNPKVIMKNIRAALSISAGGITLCFALGTAVGYGMYNNLTDKTEKFSSFVIFICVAMSITAFPVLARILSELDVIRTPVGIAALTASVNDDVVSWISLALVVSLVNSSSNLTALYIFLLCIGWVLIVVLIIRPLFIKLIIKTGSNDNGPTLAMMIITLSTVLISAFVTSAIGIHAILGGFIIGVIIPHEGGFALKITEKIEDLVSVLFLPIYFALSGLKTHLDLLNDGKVWVWVLIVISCAMSGKIIGCSLMARINKYTWRESITIGIFMSCKGLVELIILNIGYDAKVIDNRIFVIMIVMALFTTISTSPLTSWTYSSKHQKKIEIEKSSNVPREKLDKSKHGKLLVILNAVEWLPAVMTLIKLLQPLPNSTRRKSIDIRSTGGVEQHDSAQASSSKREQHNIDESLIVHALRTIELTQRMSTVMKFNESEETTLRDPIMNVFRMFGHLNFVNIKASLSVAPLQNFAKQVAESVRETGSEMVIIPWSGAGAIINDDIHDGAKEQKDTSPLLANFVQEVFEEVDTNVGLLIDRGLGKAMSSEGTSIKVYLPFFGGIDDREALSFVVRLLKHPRVTVTVLRIKKSNEPTNNDITLGMSNPSLTNLNPHNNDELERPPLAHEMSTASEHVLESNVERELSDKADESLLSEYFNVKTGTLTNNLKINYSEISSSTVLQTAVERGKDVVTRKDLIVIGRGRRKANVSHREEFVELIRNLGLSYGNDTRKCLGDIAEAFLAKQIASSLFVIQGKKPNP